MSNDNKVIICKMPDGKVAIIVPAEGVPVEDCVAHVPEDALSHRVALKSDVPNDRTFRNAWTDDLESITVDVDMPKAREIHRNKLRDLRKPQFEKYDHLERLELERDDPSPGFIKDVRKIKKELRDCTKSPDIEAAETPEELKACTHSLLSD